MRTILLLIGLLLTTACSALSFDYKTECVGSYTLALPDDLEVALYPTESYLKPKSKYPVYFKDGKWAYLSYFYYNDNILMITDIWEDDKSLSIVNESFNISYNKTKQKNDNSKFNTISFDQGMGYYSDFSSNLSYIINNRVYHFYTNERYQGQQRDFEFYKHNAEAIVAGFSSRKLFEVPSAAGKCIPYGFIASDNPDTPIDLSVSFRPNQHPDVMITFTENTNIITHSIKSTAKAELENFWNFGYDYSNENIAGIKLLGFPKYKNIKMAGREGKSTFVEIKYKDGSPSDYGYYAVVNWSNPAPNIIKPWIQLSVIGKVSESKDKIPLTKEEIYELAKTIEASILRRDSE